MEYDMCLIKELNSCYWALLRFSSYLEINALDAFMYRNYYLTVYEDYYMVIDHEIIKFGEYDYG